MEKIKIFLDISDDGTDTLEQNQINIETLLDDEKIEAEIERGVVSYESQEGSRSKDIVLIILAASASIVSVGYAIGNVINTLNNKKQVVEFEALEEIKDKDGNPVLDNEGKPIFKVVKKFEIIDPAQNDLSSLELSIYKFFKVKISSRR